jgi:hypothetical protein
MYVDEYGYISIEDSIKSVTVIALIVLVLWPILAFFGLITNVFKGMYNLIVDKVKGAVNALIKII